MKKITIKQQILGIVLTLTAFALVSCANPLTLKKDAPEAVATGGTISLSIPVISPLMLEALSSDSPSSSARAYAVATSVHFKLFDSNDTLVRESTLSAKDVNDTKEWLIGFTMSNVKVGENYKLELSVFNTHVSPTVPVVEGTAIGIKVELDKTTEVTVKCIPVSSTSFTVGNPISLNLTKFKEAWYSTEVTKDTTYYFTEESNGRVFGLFKTDGSFIGSYDSYASYKADYAGLLYIVILQADYPKDIDHDSALTMSTTPPVLNQGTPTAPIPLTVGTEHNFSIGTSGTSYYSFTTGEEGTYVLKLDVPSPYSAYLYSSSTFSSGSLGSASSIYEGLSLGLSGDTTYYLKLSNSSSKNALIKKGLLISPTTFALEKKSEGSIAEPISLELNSSTPGKIGFHQYDSLSYYTFTTNATDLDYSLNFSDLSADSSNQWALYSDSNYSSSVDWGNLTSNSSVPLVLLPSTQYYLAISNQTGTTTSSFKLEIKNHTQTYLNTLTPDAVWIQDTLVAGQDTVWYKVPVTASTQYSVYLDTADTNATGGMTAKANCSAYYEDRTTSYYLSSISNFNIPVYFQARTGDSYVYIKIQAKEGSTGTFKVKLVTRTAPEKNLPLSIGDAWTVETITYDNTAIWYKIPVTSGTSYSVYVDDSSSNGSGLATAKVGSSLYKENKTTSYYSPNSGTYAVPATFTAEESNAYLKITPSSYLGTAGTFRLRVLARTETTTNLALSNTWTTGSINYEQTHWYKVTVEAGKKYAVYLDNASEGSQAYTANVYLLGCKGNKATTYFYEQSKFYINPGLATISNGETELWLRVRSSTSANGIGNYAVKVSEVVDPVNDLLVGAAWTPGEITGLNKTIWYKVPVTAGNSYSVWFDDKYSGSGVFTCDAKIAGYRDDQTTSYFITIDSAYAIARTVTIAAGQEFLFLKVEPYSGSNNGTFAVKVTAN